MNTTFPLSRIVKLMIVTYAAHHCDILVFDGNLKNHRDVCFATSAGYAEYRGLDGHIKIGCQETPSFKSELHKPTIAPQDSLLQVDPTTELGFMVGKKPTKNSVLYKVHDIACALVITH